MARRLTNNPLRGSMNWSRPKSPGHRTTRLSLPKRSIRRLIKRNPADGLSLPFFDKVTDTKNVKGLSGASPVRSISSKARTAAPNAGVRVVQDRGTNKTLKKR